MTGITALAFVLAVTAPGSPAHSGPARPRAHSVVYTATAHLGSLADLSEKTLARGKATQGETYAVAC